MERREEISEMEAIMRALLNEKLYSPVTTIEADMNFYTSYAEINRILNQFVSDATENEIWVSIDAMEMKKNRLGNRFLEVMEMNLDYVKEHCSQTMDPKERIVRLRVRGMQRQLFIKMQFTCEPFENPEKDSRIQEIKRLVESVGGYFKLISSDKVIDIHLSVPV